jgi:hypothetical protein
MSLLPRSPRIFAATVAALGIGLLVSLPLVAQPMEQSGVDISRSSTVREPNPPHIDFNNGIVNVRLTNTYGSKDETDPGRLMAQELGTLKVLPAPGSGAELTAQHSGGDRRFFRGRTLVSLRQENASAEKFN